MKKSVLLSAALLIGAMSLTLVGCNREDPINTNEEVAVNEDPYKDYPRLGSVSEIATRVSYEGLIEESGSRSFKSSLEQGDQIRIWVDGPKGTYAYDYTYVAKGKNWEPKEKGKEAPDGDGLYYYAEWNGANFAFLNGTHIITKNTNLKAVEFFHDALREWCLGTGHLNIKDQNSKEKFEKQDIIIGKGTKSGNMVKFEMNHALALACIQYFEPNSTVEVSSTKYLSTDHNYTWEEKTTTDKIVGPLGGCNPYHPENDNWMYLWVAPKEIIQATVISSDNNWSRSLSIKSGSFARFKFHETNPQSEAFVLEPGDIFFSDGSLAHNQEATAKAETQGRTPIGIVVSIDNKSVDEDAITALTNTQSKYVNRGNGFHGLVLASKNAGGNTAPGDYKWSSGNTNVSELAKVNTYTGLLADMDGYKHTQTIVNLSSYTQNNYPAFYAAVNFNSTLNCSNTATTGWFLPSSGQWMLVFKDFAGANMDSPVILNGYAEIKDIRKGETFTRAMWQDILNQLPYTDTNNNTVKKLGESEPILTKDNNREEIFVVVDCLAEGVYIDEMLKNAGQPSSADMQRSNVMYRSSTQMTSAVAAMFSIGSTIGELSISSDHLKTEDRFVRPMLAF